MIKCLISKMSEQLIILFTKPQVSEKYQNFGVVEKKIA